MMKYSIKKINTAPDWSEIETLTIGNKYFDTPEDVNAFAQLCYDSERLYVHLIAEEPSTRAVETSVLGMPCEDSCLEFFFCPMENDNRYFNLEYNLNGCLFFGFGSGIKDLVRLTAAEEENFNKLFNTDAKKNDKGWELFYSIPFEFIKRFFKDFEIYGGKKIRANCYKCSDLTVPSNYLAWNPIVDEPFRFHRPECFGEMTFSD
jgi:hypothetical protein